MNVKILSQNQLKLLIKKQQNKIKGVSKQIKHKKDLLRQYKIELKTLKEELNSRSRANE